MKNSNFSPKTIIKNVGKSKLKLRKKEKKVSFNSPRFPLLFWLKSQPHTTSTHTCTCIYKESNKKKHASVKFMYKPKEHGREFYLLLSLLLVLLLFFFGSNETRSYLLSNKETLALGMRATFFPRCWFEGKKETLFFSKAQAIIFFLHVRVTIQFFSENILFYAPTLRRRGFFSPVRLSAFFCIRVSDIDKRI